MHPRRSWIVLVSVLAVLAILLGLRLAAPSLIAARVQRAAGARGLTASWRSLRVGFPPQAAFRGLVLARPAHGDTLVTADTLAVRVAPRSLLLLHPRPATIELAHVRVRLAAPRPGLADTLAPAEMPEPAESPRAGRLRRSASQLVRLLLAPARRLPQLHVRDLTIEVPAADEALLRGAHLAWLALDRTSGGVRLSARGAFALERDVPFELGLAYDHDDRLLGGAALGVPDSAGRVVDTLRLAVRGALTQDRRAGVLRLADSTRVLIGDVPLVMGGTLERTGPRLRFQLAADGVTEARVLESVPGPVLGPLRGLAVRGSFDYRLALDLDLAAPDSVRFDADVIPHGLQIDAARSTLDVFRLNGPFTAAIHLPRGRIAHRELSPENPWFRPLAGLDSTLVRAVLANEDGGFFHHRGFNTEAVKLAIAANVKAGAYKRGAGTITMQLARNLWLGHARTLSRKAQEVVLAWTLENLTGVSKQRLLEIYLNIIEWGPDVQGAAEATRYYFDKDPARLTVDEALFLTTVIPAPSRWRYRFAPDGTLRAFEQAQMHFIGRAMVARGWLAPGALPARESLRVELRGPARQLVFPPDSVATLAGAARVPPRAGPEG